MPTESDPTLVRRLEQAEIAAWRAFQLAASFDSANACGLGMLEDDGAVAVRATAADVLALNRVIGLGLERVASEALIERLIEFFVGQDVQRFFVQVSPIAEPSGIGELLEAHGFRHYNNWVKFHRDVAPPLPVSTDLTIRTIGEDEAQSFGRTVATCFDWPEPTVSWLADTVGREGWCHYMAFDGSDPAATGALFVSEDLGWIDFATTLPEYRGRGAQSALLAQRIRDAAELGCQGLVVETAEDRPEKPAPSYRNQLRFGFKIEYARPNYIYSTADS